MTAAGKQVAILVALAVLSGIPALGEAILYRQGADGDGVVRALWFDGSGLAIFTSDDVYHQWSDGLTEHPFFGAEVGGAAVQEVVPGEDGLYLLLAEYEGTKCVGARLAGVSFDAEGNASLGEGVALEWDEMIDGQGGGAHCRDGYFPMVAGGFYAFVVRDGEWTGGLAVYDLLTSEGEFYDSDADGYQLDIVNVCAYGDGTGLIACAADREVAIHEIDFATGETRELCAIPADDPPSLAALAYDAEADRLYYLLDDALSRMTGFDAGSAEALLTGAPVESFLDISCALLPGGRFALADWHTVALFDPDAPATDLTLTVAGFYDQAIDDAALAFSGARPDVDVRVENANLAPGDVSQAILMQSREYDIYTTSLNWRDYGALYSRGYLPELTDSAAMTALVGGMYPQVRTVLEKDGALVALPIGYDMTMVAVNSDALNAIGLAEADIPETWPEFLRLLQRLPNLLAHAEASAFEPGGGPEDLRRALFQSLLRAYQLYLEYDPDAGMRFDSEPMRAMLAEFEKVDFNALSTDEGWDGGDYSAENALFRLEYGFGLQYGQEESLSAMPLAIADGIAPMVHTGITVAIVNPYSPHVGAAVEFLETVAARIPGPVLAGLTPGMDEGILWSNHGDTIAFYERCIAEVETERASAKTDDDREKWGENLDTLKTNCAEYLANPWEVSPEAIAEYRAYAELMRVWQYFGFSDYDKIGGEFYAVVGMYLDGAIDAETMLKRLDEKVNMMLRENAE